jgi:hypothetical protein
MKLVTITTETGTVQYQLVNGSALPAIKAGQLTFETRSGVQSIPAGAVLDFTIEAGRAGSKSDRLKSELSGALDNLSALAATVHDEANNSTIPEDAAFSGALVAYAEAFGDFAVQKAKAEKFFARRAETERKRAAGETKPRTRKAAPAPAPVEMTPTPKAKRAKK